MTVHSAIRCRERTGVHAQPPHSARRLEGGTILFMVRRMPAHDNNQANVLIGVDFHACLTDFGFSTFISVEHPAASKTSLISASSDGSLMSFTAGGTARWMSPELLVPYQFGATDYRPTKQSNCYAFGMVIYEVRANGAVPNFTAV